MSNDVATDIAEFAAEVGKSVSRKRPRAEELTSTPPSAGVEVSSSAKEMWAIYGGHMYSACEAAVGSLPPGQYTIEHNNQIGIYFNLHHVNLDDLVHLPDSVSDAVIREIRTFWTKEEHFRKFGFLWKRGVLLFGPPGSGKTSTLQVVAKEVIDSGGVAVYVSNPRLASLGLKIMREVEPSRPIVVMLEDVDAIVEEYGEAELLAVMDGELQIDNVVFIATTNYLSRLDPRFVCRPSRFDIVRKIDYPNESARRVYLTSKNKRLATEERAEELKQWVGATKGFSVAHLKELIVSIEVFEVPFKDAVERLRELTKVPTDTDNFKKKVGFTNTDNDGD